MPRIDFKPIRSLELLRRAWTDDDTRALVLLKAADCVLAARQCVYGDPQRNFANIARLWNAYLRAKATEEVGNDYWVDELRGADVAIFEILVRVARLAETPDYFDSWVDAAGYAACGARCAEILANPPTQDAAGL